MSKQTAIYSLHCDLQAQMVDFAGWKMPLHYGSTLDEHHAVRKDAGFFDVSHMTVVDIKGPKTIAFMRHLVSNDVGKLKQPGKALYTCMLQNDGGILDDLICYYVADDFYRVIVNAGTTENDVAWISQHARDFDLTVTQRDDLSMIAVQGPKAREKTNRLLPSKLASDAEDMSLFSFALDEETDWFVARTGYTGEDGYEVVMPSGEAVEFVQKLLQEDVRPCGLGARDTLRLEAGLNLYGTDMDTSVTPYEANLAWTVDLKDESRSFIGKEALLAHKEKGLKEKLVGLVLRDKGVLRNGQQVRLKSGEVGKLTSGGFAPSLQESIAFARIPREDVTSVEVNVRNKWLRCDIVKPPFIKAGNKTF